jgi:hypothetical protein
MLSIYLHLGLPSGLFLSGFLTNNLYTFLFASIRATCPTHLILLDFIILIILGEEHQLSTEDNQIKKECTRTVMPCPLMSNHGIKKPWNSKDGRRGCMELFCNGLHRFKFFFLTKSPYAILKQTNKTTSVALSPQANYTD